MNSRSNQRISILMPTYNDEEYIRKAIESVLSQTHENWELLIMDDGSTDQTREKVKSFIERVPKKIFYFKQRNAGQLNAILNLVPHISGDCVTLLHSDDVLLYHDALRDAIDFLNKSGADGIYSDIVILDADGRKVGVRKVFFSIKELIISGGSNCIPDIFFLTKDAFFRHVKNNYLVGNMPYYLNLANGKMELPNLAKCPTPWYGYRVYAGNYGRSPEGLFVEINGKFRTIATFYRNSLIIKPEMLLKNKFCRSALLKFYEIWPAVAEKNCSIKSAADSHRSIKQLEKLLDFEINRIRSKSQMADINEYVERVLASVSDLRNIIMRKKPSKPLIVERDEVKGIPKYFGKDARVVYRQIAEKTLPKLVGTLFLKNYDAVICDCRETKEIISNIMNLFNYFTPVILKNELNNLFN